LEDLEVAVSHGMLEEKIEDYWFVGMRLNKSSGAISLHIPWDIPENAVAYKSTGCTKWFKVRCNELKYFPGST
jgi:L-rhamnose isomerase